MDAEKNTNNQTNKNILMADVVTGKSFTAAAINVAAKAGEYIKSKLGDSGDVHLKGSAQDLVTEVDRGSEKMVRTLLKTYFPTHAFLGEENVDEDNDTDIENAEYVWIIDPLDGTTNYVHAFPFFAVSIALAHKGEVIVGVVYDPIHDEMFVAEKGKGAYLRGMPMHVSDEVELSGSLLATGFPADQGKNLIANMADLNALAPKVRSIRAGGSAALHLAYVAAGRLSGYWEVGLKPWDIAAGALLVQQAGGRITARSGMPYKLTTSDIFATNGKIHQELQDTFAMLTP
jgi:myo-inositol-1(or 4)-monophosphatase